MTSTRPVRAPVHRLLVLVLAVPAFAVLAVLAFAWPAARIQPRDLPVGVVGSTPTSQRAAEQLSRAEPGAFDLHLYADAGAARAAIEHRDVYGALVADPQRITVLEASAAGPSVAQLLTGVGQRLAARSHIPLETVDVVPLSRADPKGLAFSSSLLPLTIIGIASAALIGVLVGLRPAGRQIAALLAVAAIAGLGTYLVAQSFLGALPHHAVATWAALSLTILAVAATTAGLVALAGSPGLAPAAGLLVFVGNPFSGANSAPELLPDAVHRVGQWLPPGAGAELLRSVTYFDGHGTATQLGVLLTWSGLGLAAVAIGHHSPIRFAAHRASVGTNTGTPTHQLASAA